MGLMPMEKQQDVPKSKGGGRSILMTDVGDGRCRQKVVCR